MKKTLILYITLIINPFSHIYSQDDGNFQLNEGIRLDSQYYGMIKQLYKTKPDLALDYADKAAHHAKLNGQYQIEVRSVFAKSLIYYNKQEWDKSEFYLNESLDLAIKYKTIDRLPYIYELFGLINLRSWKYDNAITNYLQVIKYSDQVKNNKLIAIAYNQLGIIYLRLEKYEEALNNFRQSLQYKQEYNLEGIDLNKLNIGICLSRLSQYNEALEIFNELLLNTDDFNNEMMIELFLGLGYCNLMLGEYAFSQKFLLKSLDYINDKSEEKYVTIYSFLSTLHKKKHNIDSSIQFLRRSLEYAKEYKYAPIIANNSRILSEYYAADGEFKKAYETINDAFILHDSIFSADLSENIRDSYLDFQQYQSDQVISTKEKAIQRNKQFMIMLGIILVLLIVILAFAYRTLTFRRRLNEKLDDMVQMKTKELINANDELVRSRKELDSFLYRTSHDIRGPIATLMGLTKLARMEARDHLIQSYLDKIDTTSGKLNTVISRLTNVSQINSQPLDIDKVNVYQMVDEVIKDLNINRSKIAFKFKGNTSPEIITDKILVKIILENLLDNSFKFSDNSERNPFVELDIEQNGNLEFTVTDNGVGIDPEYRDRVFDLFFVASEKTRGAGIGLYQTQLATAKLHGKVILETNKKPTRFKVIIPPNGDKKEEAAA